MNGKDYKVRTDVMPYERIRKRWTQEDLARHSGMSLGQISRIEDGKIDSPHFATIDKIAKALELDEDDLIEWRMPIPA